MGRSRLWHGGAWFGIDEIKSSEHFLIGDEAASYLLMKHLRFEEKAVPNNVFHPIRAAQNPAWW